MRKRRAVAGLAVLAALCGNTAPPQVRLDSGEVRGVALGAGAAFRGIPYAAPPVGANRWREAQPVAPWSEVRDASAFGPACIQAQPASRPQLPQSENCLTVNVVTPDRAAKNLPVIVSIHGGAFAFGSGRDVAEDDLSPMVRRGAILVSPNYRVGRMGFFAHPALTAEGGRPTGNFWLSDQILALDWVRRNIAAFGGDPARVTIVGCSAGGSSINALMAAPAARGLFARASARSGGGFFNATRPLATAEQQGVEFARRAGVRGSGAAALARLRVLSPSAVIAADPGPPNFGAIIDRRLVPQATSLTFARGEQAPVPYMVGSTSNEASVFGLMGFDAKVLRDRFGIELEALRPIYAQGGAIDDAELLRQVQTDFIFTSAAMGMASLAARTAPAWAYHFDYVPAADRASSPGAAHCADMDYLFGPPPEDSAEGRHAAAMLQESLFNFAASGNPNGPGVAEWPQVDPGAVTALVIRDRAVAEADFRRAQLAPWQAKWRSETGAALAP